MTSPFVSLEKAAADMHQGVGAESLLQTGRAWGAVAQKLAARADEMLLVIISCDGQYWQGPAAQQMRDVLISVAQGLKNNAVVAGQIETAATTVVAAFNKARAATPTPQHVADNRERRAQLVAADRLRLHQPQIAELDADYEVMWLRSITVYDTYYQDTSYALTRGEQPWWSPHQRSAQAPTTVGDRPPIPDAPDIPAQITQHRDAAAWCRICALDHALRTREHQEAYEQHSTYARTCEGLADHGNATAELYNKMAQHHREVVQVYKDLPLGQAEKPALAHKFVDLATTWHQTKHQADTTIDAYRAASETQPHLQETGNNLSEINRTFANDMTNFFAFRNLDLENPDLDSYTNSLQGYSERIANGTYSTRWETALHEGAATGNASAVERFRGCALARAEEAGDAWRAAHQHVQPITDHVRDFVARLQMAVRQDNQATTLAGLSA